MSNKNVLFVGDLKNAHNYGAIATSENLRRLVEEVVDKKNIKYIESRSFYNETPEEGWNDFSISKKGLKHFIAKKIPVLVTLKNIFKKRVNFIKEPHVAYKWELFDSYAKDVMDGKRLKYELNLLKWADIVYISSEGNIVKGTDAGGYYRAGGLYVLFIAYIAKKYLNKTVYIVNHTVDPQNRDIDKIICNVYPMLDKIYIREKLSIKKLLDKGVNNIEFVPDALFSYKPLEENWTPSESLKNIIDFSKPYICLGDSSGIKSGYSHVKWDVYENYKKLIIELKKVVPQVIFVDGFNNGHVDIERAINETEIGKVNLSNCSYKELFHVLKHSEIFISGRWHNSILAVLSGTPILLWGADSHKTEGLYDLLDYPYEFFNIHSLPIHIDDIVNETKNILSSRNEVKEDILEKVKPLRTEVYRNAEILRTLNNE